MFTSSIYRCLARALFLSSMVVWAVARTTIFDIWYAHWQLLSCSAWATSALLATYACSRRIDDMHGYASLLMTALGVGIGAGFIFIINARLNLAYGLLVLSCTYAFLVVARRIAWYSTKGIFADAATGGMVGLFLTAGLSFGTDINARALRASFIMIGVNIITLSACSRALDRFARRGLPVGRAAFLPWGVLCTSMLMASAAVLFLRYQHHGSLSQDATFSADARDITLTPEQYRCTQEGATETPFANAYWDQHAHGIYVDVISGEPLYSSRDKYDSGTGWPSFTKPLRDHVRKRGDLLQRDSRIEVRSKQSDAHLGHVFDDGPPPHGKRFCINSAALRFVPLAEMKEAGYSAYLFDFAQPLGWQVATLAGGCFWGMEDVFGDQPGVVATQVGYAGGSAEQPSYDQVVSGHTGHAEVLQILFNPTELSFEQLLLFFFRIHDPTTRNRQGSDVGTQYRSAIFYADEMQQRIALQVMARVNASHQWAYPLTTQLAPLTAFWRAEDEHQGYIERHPNAYTCHEKRHLDFAAPSP